MYRCRVLKRVNGLEISQYLPVAKTLSSLGLGSSESLSFVSEPSSRKEEIINYPV